MDWPVGDLAAFAAVLVEEGSMGVVGHFLVSNQFLGDTFLVR